jgi:hypothetical protein
MGIDDTNFRGGSRVAVGDFDGDGTPDLAVAAGEGGGSRVAIFDGETVLTQPERLVADFFAMPGDTRSGVRLAASDEDGDGAADLIVATGTGLAVRIRTLSGKVLVEDGPAAAALAPLSEYRPGDAAATIGGWILSSSDLDGDGTPDTFGLARDPEADAPPTTPPERPLVATFTDPTADVWAPLLG